MSTAQLQLQRPETWNVDAIISLENIRTRRQRILADQKRQIDAIRRKHPELDCESLIRNLSELQESNTEETRLLSLAAAGVQAAASSRHWE
jgi:hypothetical protein